MRERAYDGGGGLQAGQHDRSLHAKGLVQSGRSLDMEDEKGRPSCDGVKGVRPQHNQAQNFQYGV